MSLSLATPVVDRHVVIVSAAGSFTAAGDRLTGPVNCVDRLEKLIEWAHTRGLLAPIPAGAGVDDGCDPARVWLVGSGCRPLIGAGDTGHRDLVEELGRSLAPLVGRGWELRRGVGPAVLFGARCGPAPGWG